MFGFGKKKAKNEVDRVSGGICDSAQISGRQDSARVKVLGGGCAKCHTLYDNAVSALNELGGEATAELITDFAVIASYGVMSTPALVIDGKVVSYGRVPGIAEVKKLLEANL